MVMFVNNSHLHSGGFLIVVIQSKMMLIHHKAQTKIKTSTGAKNILTSIFKTTYFYMYFISKIS